MLESSFYKLQQMNSDTAAAERVEQENSKWITKFTDSVEIKEDDIMEIWGRVCMNKGQDF